MHAGLALCHTVGEMHSPLKQHYRRTSQGFGFTSLGPAPINACALATTDDPITRFCRFHQGSSGEAFPKKYRVYTLTDALGAPIHLGLENSCDPSASRTTVLPAKLSPRPQFNSTTLEHKLWDLWFEDDEPRYTVLGQFETRLSGLQALDWLRDELSPEELRWMINAKRAEKPRVSWIYALVEQELDQVFYVGQTVDFDHRKWEHFNLADNPLIAARMAEARGHGHEPRMLELEKVGNRCDANDSERRWIHLMLKQGQRLVNRELYGWQRQGADFQVPGHPSGGGHGRSHRDQVLEVSNQPAMRESRGGA